MRKESAEAHNSQTPLCQHRGRLSQNFNAFPQQLGAQPNHELLKI